VETEEEELHDAEDKVNDRYEDDDLILPDIEFYEDGKWKYL
jgi:hypothetical protein